MKQVKHSLEFITEFDETNPVAMRFLELSNEIQVTMLEGMLKSLLVPRIQPALDELNENNSYATLKVAE